MKLWGITGWGLLAVLLFLGSRPEPMVEVWEILVAHPTGGQSTVWAESSVEAAGVQNTLRLRGFKILSVQPRKERRSWVAEALEESRKQFSI